METFLLMEPFYCDRILSGDTHVGTIYHVDRNEWGGSNSTPVGRYFAWKHPGDAECLNDHYRRFATQPLPMSVCWPEPTR